MIDGQNFFNQPRTNYLITFNNILDCNYFKNCYKRIVIDLSKQEALDADLKAMQKLILLEIYKINQQ